jgi:GAF domain-containing protein
LTGAHLQQGELTRNGPQNTIAAALRFPAEDAGRSLADLVRRDLDAALQLLTDRAQYITGASGAAIALKRNGMNDMLCRASTGENAPELGALLSTEYGLSGESVRTRQALRCDDAEHDDRVNREVCRQLGIASVVVMPVVDDDEVLGVFELFSGQANAFGERDLSAVQRLTEMVQTAVRLANAAEQLPEKLNAAQAPSEVNAIDAKEPLAVEPVAVEEDILDEHLPDEHVLDESVLDEQVLDEHLLEVETVEAVEPPAPVPGVVQEIVQGIVQEIAQKVVQKPDTVVAATPSPRPESIGAMPPALKPEPIREHEPIAAPAVAVAGEPKPAAATPASQPTPSREPVPAVGAASISAVEPEIPTVEIPKAASRIAPPDFVSPKKKLFWSAALDLASEAKAADSDESHVPPVLRGLRKCEACGFPVSAGRVLCVECEEKKWRGQLRKPPANGNAAPSGKAALAGTGAVEKAAGVTTATKAAPVASAAAASAVSPASAEVSKKAQVPALSTEIPSTGNPSTEHASTDLSAEKALPVQAPFEQAAPELVLSAAAAPRQSWISAHKYIVVALLVAAAIVAIFLSR